MVRRFGHWCAEALLPCCLVLAFGHAVPGQDSTADLVESARQAMGGFTPWTAQRVAQSKQQLRQALEQLERHVAKSGDDIVRGWKAYLEWPALMEQLDRDGPPDKPYLAQLERTRRRFYGDADGLELAAFLTARERLQAHINAVLFSSQRNLPKAYAAQVGELAKRLAAFTDSWSSEDGYVIGRLIGQLERTGQAESLVQQVRGSYWRPNLDARVSSRLVKAGLTEPVDDRSPVEEHIMGTRIVAQAHTVGAVRAKLVPDEKAASVSIQLLASSSSDNVGYRSNLRIYSSGVVDIDARKTLRFDGKRVTAEPTVAHCAGRTTITAVGSRSRLVSSIVCRVAQRKQPEAQCIGDQLAERRVSEEFDKQSADLLQQANDKFRHQLRNPLIRRDAYPRVLNLRTTSESITAQLLQVSPFQLAAPTAPPPFLAQHDMALRMHESAVCNFAESVLGGETFTDVRLAKLVEQATGSVPEELQIGPEKDPWSITFDPNRTVTAHFRDNVFTVAVRGVRFSRGDQEITDRIEISASYQVERTDDGARLTRRGDVEVAFPDETRLDVAKVAMKTFMRRKFEALFEPEVATRGFRLPGRLERAGPLQLQQLHCDQGWLVLGWRLAS